MKTNELFRVRDAGIELVTPKSQEEFDEAVDDGMTFEELLPAMHLAINCLSERVMELEKENKELWKQIKRLEYA